VWELIEEFDARRDAYLWSETTFLQHWTAIRSAATTVDLVWPVELKIRSEVLGFLAKENEAKRPTVAATELDIVTTCKALPNELAIATTVAFNLGQRIGDVMMLEKSRVGTILDPHSKAKLVTLQLL
jgi:hypothetical protein